MRHIDIKIFGKVQGVFFRHSAKENAEELGIKGFIKNEPDGTVYAEAEGSDVEIKKFIEWIRQGPPAAQVKNVEIKDGELKNFENFKIL